MAKSLVSCFFWLTVYSNGSDRTHRCRRTDILQRRTPSSSSHTAPPYTFQWAMSQHVSLSKNTSFRGGIWTPIQHMVVLPHTMLHAKRYLDRLSCLCRAYGRDLTHRQTDHTTPPVSHLCLAGLPEVAMPYSDKIARFHSCTPGHATPSRAIGWSTPRSFMETSTGSTTYQMDRPTPPR